MPTRQDGFENRDKVYRSDLSTYFFMPYISAAKTYIFHSDYQKVSLRYFQCTICYVKQSTNWISLHVNATKDISLISCPLLSLLSIFNEILAQSLTTQTIQTTKRFRQNYFDQHFNLQRLFLWFSFISNIIVQYKGTPRFVVFT